MWRRVVFLLIYASYVCVSSDASAQNDRTRAALRSLRSLYDACSPDYAKSRDEFYRDLARLMQEHIIGAQKAAGAHRFNAMRVEYAKAMEYSGYIGRLPPVSLPKPCPKEPPPFAIPGTAIRVYDADLAAKWGQKLNQLRTNKCSNAHPVLLRRAREDAEDDRAARERAAGQTGDANLRAKLESDAKALEQVESLFPSEPCSLRSTGSSGVAATPAPQSAGGTPRYPIIGYEAVPPAPFFYGVPRYRSEPFTHTGILAETSFNFSVVPNVDVANDGLGGKLDVPVFGGRVGLTLPVRNADLPFTGFAFDVYGLAGDARKDSGPSGTAATTYNVPQGPGSVQVVTGQLTGQTIDASLKKYGTTLSVSGVPTVLGDGTVTFTPNIWTGFEQLQQVTRVNSFFAGLNFSNSYWRKVRTNRWRGGVGGDIVWTLGGGWSLESYLRGGLDSNWVSGQSIYTFNQNPGIGFGSVPFAIDKHYWSPDLYTRFGIAKTWGGQAADVVRGKVGFFVWANYQSVPNMVAHVGSPATIEQNSTTEYGAELSLILQWRTAHGP